MEKFSAAGPDNSKKPPQFIREFSRENSPEERSEMAAAIREKRQERDAFRVEQTELTVEQERLVSELNELKEKIEEYNSAGFLHKITDYLEYRQLQAAAAEHLEAQGKVERALQELGETPPMFEEPKKMLEEFYYGEQQKWAEAGYDPEDIKKHFSEENLSKLNLEEYALLMQRFPGEMVTHVTRQGIRDHASTGFHTAGMGESHNGFKTILKEGRLRSAVGIALQKKGKEDAMASYLGLDSLKDIDLNRPNMTKRDRALAMYGNNFDRFDDKAAIHVATEEVMNEMYGGETGNEIFLAYPSAHIASQHMYEGALHMAVTKGLGNEKSEHNDTGVFTKDHNGLSVESAIVFIPEDTQVDTKTGSKYETNSEGELDLENAVNEIMAARFEKPGFIQTFGQSMSWKLEGLSGEERQQFLSKAYKEFTITDPRAQQALQDPKFIEDVLNNLWGKSYEKEVYQQAVSEYFKNLRNYDLAKDTITSREYWEKYFTEHPEQRPSKIVFYRGGNPAEALHEWRKNSGITKTTADATYGFPENRNKPEDELDKDKERFASLALKIIDERFPEEEGIVQE